MLNHFPHLKFTSEKIYAPFPKIKTERCRYCGICAKVCTGNAILFDKYIPSVKVDSASCYACAECIKACTRQGIEVIDKLAGEVLTSIDSHAEIMIGKLDESSDFEIPLVKVMTDRILTESDLIADVGPGATEANKVALLAMHMGVIIVSQGNNWKTTLESIKKLCLDAKCVCGILTNKAETKREFIHEITAYCEFHHLTYLGNLPDFDLPVANKITPETKKQIESHFANLWENILKLKRNNLNNI